MKKLFTLTRVALTLLLFMAGFNQVSAGATWVGNSAIQVNGTWYYCGTDLGSWCTGGGFDEAELGTITSLVIGAQSQVSSDNGDWKSGTLTMHYTFDKDESGWKDHTLSYESYGHGQFSNNMRFQSGGSTFTTTTIDISSLSAGKHTLSIYFGPLDGNYDSNSGNNYVAKFTIPATQTITVPSSGKGTYSSAFNLNFSSTSNISAYVVSSLTSTAATLTKVQQKVPAGTGLIIMGVANASEGISVVTSADAIATTNKLQASVTATTVATDYAYVLSNGEFHPANAGTIPANRAYLLKSDIPANARSLNLVFDETTGISTTQMANDLLSKDFFNLAGQRVAQPTKGFYIVNGKKVIIK
jgi:hypothetical protein